MQWNLRQMRNTCDEPATAGLRHPPRLRQFRAAMTLPAPRDQLTLRRPPGPASFVPLQTDRFTLRPFRPEDAEEMHRLVNDWEVVRMLSRLPFPYPRALADDWIASTERSLAEGSAWHLAITGREGEREMIVGAVGLRLERGRRSATLGYWVGRRFWRHGAASEAAGRLARWALAHLDLDRLTATVAIDNPASAAVLRRIGFREVGEGREAFLARGGEHPVQVFEATRDDLFGAVEGDPATAPEGGKPLLLVAACALIDTDSRVLLARRPEGKKMAGLWEFPGGKLNPGETPEAALIRELKEELAIDVAEACLAPFAFASHAYERFHLLMPLYLCRRWRGRMEPREGQALAWVRPHKLAEFPMPPADKPLIPLLRDFL
jgi:8-oxo-dGTP diphosphatase